MVKNDDKKSMKMPEMSLKMTVRQLKDTSIF
jgi:hypothetical protein